MTPASSRHPHLSAAIGNRFIPWAITLVIAMLVVVFWLRLVEENRSERQAILEANANWVVSEVTGHVRPLALALVRMASRAAQHDAMGHEEWMADARLYADHFPGYLAVLWLEADGRIRWNQQPTASADATAIPDSAVLMASSLAECPLGNGSYTLCTFTIPGNGMGLTILAPIVRNGRIEGYITGIFDTEATFADPVIPDFSPTLQVRLRQGDTTIFRRGPHASGGATFTPEITKAVPLAGLDWQIEIDEQLHLIPRGLPSLPDLLLGTGLTLAALLGLMTHLAQQAVRRTRLVQQNAERFQQLAENIREVFWISDSEKQQLLYLSPAYESLWGRSREGLFPDPEKIFLQSLHEDDAQRVRARRLACFERNAEFDDDYRIRLPDGRCRWVHTRAFPVAASGGQSSRVVGIAEDITERKEAELARQLALEKYRNLVETTEDWVWEIDAEYRYTYSNPRCLDLLGYTPEEILGRTPFELMPPTEARRIAAIVKPITQRHQPIIALRNVNLHKNGSEVVLETSGVPVFDAAGNLAGYHGIDRDITARLEIENALRASEAELRLITDNLPALIGYLDRDQRFRFTNRTFKAWFGLNPEQINSRHWREILDPGAHDRIQARIERVLAGESVHFEDELIYPRVGRRWVAGSYLPHRDVKGDVIGLFVMIADITPMVQAHRRLEESEARFRYLAENIPEIFFITDGVSRELLYVSPAYEKVWDLPREDRYPDLEKLLFTYLDPEDAPRVNAERERCYRLKQPFRAEFRYTHPERGARWARIQATPILDADDELKHYVGIAEDITERKQIEEERIARVEEQRDLLIREIHHRIKNTLQGVGGLLQRHLDEHPDTQAALREAIAQINSIAAVYGLQGGIARPPIDIQGLLGAILTTTRQTNRDVAIDLRVEPPGCLPAACRTRVAEREAVPLALILNELLVNAIKHQTGSPREIEVLLWCEKTVSVTVRNASPALPPDFDLDRGTGLGTGLRLIKSLLPREGARLTIDHEDDATRARLELFPPVVTPNEEVDN